MKASTINLLIFVGLVVLAIYGYSKGWFSKLMSPSYTSPLSTTSTTPSSTTSTVVAPAPMNTVIVDQASLQVDHTDNGYVLIPLDMNGNVTTANKATQILRFSYLGQDCAVNYNNRVYLINLRDRNFFPHPPHHA